jgi:hypothetical protein
MPSHHQEHKPTGSAAATPGLLLVRTHIQGVRPHDRAAVLWGAEAGLDAAIGGTVVPQAGRELRADGLQQVQSASVYIPTHTRYSGRQR